MELGFKKAKNVMRQRQPHRDSINLARWEPDTPSSFLKSCGLLTKPWTHVPAGLSPAKRPGPQGASGGSSSLSRPGFRAKPRNAKGPVHAWRCLCKSFLLVLGMRGSWGSRVQCHCSSIDTAPCFLSCSLHLRRSRLWFQLLPRQLIKQPVW